MEWTSQELDTLRDAKKTHNIAWADVASKVGRSAEACRRKWQRIKGRVDVSFDALSPEVDLDEWLDAITDIQNLTLKAKPQTAIANIKIRTCGKPVAFSPISCAHFGGLYTNHRAFRDRIAKVLEIERFFIGSHGDDWEGFPADWASTVFNNLIPPELQRQVIEKLIEKLAKKNKLLYSMWSQHGSLFEEKVTGEDRAAGIYWRNGIPYFNMRGILKLYVDDVRYVLDLAHDFPGRSGTNPNHHQAKEFMRFPYADMVISGDRHKYAYQEFHTNALAHDAGFVSGRMARLVMVGTPKDGLDPYTMRFWEHSIWDFDTWPVFILSAKEHKIHRVHDYEAMNWYLDRDF